MRCANFANLAGGWFARRAELKICEAFGINERAIRVIKNFENLNERFYEEKRNLKNGEKVAKKVDLKKISIFFCQKHAKYPKIM